MHTSHCFYSESSSITDIKNNRANISKYYEDKKLLKLITNYQLSWVLNYNYTIGPTIQVRMIDIKKSCIPSEEGIGTIKNGQGKFKIKNRTMEA